MTVHISSASIDMPSVVAIRKFQNFPASAGLIMEKEKDSVLLRLRSGILRVSGDKQKTELNLSAETPALLQQLRDAVALRMKNLDTAVTWEAITGNTRPANLSLAIVVNVQRISPSYMRVAIDGPDLARFGKGSFHFRLLLGPDGADWPTVDEGGLTVWPKGGLEAWHRPVYTTRSIETRPDGSAKIDFDVFLHNGGRVTEWTRSLSIGSEIGIVGAGGGRAEQATTWRCLIGGETAMPVIARMLEQMPSGTIGSAHIIIPDIDDMQDLRHPESLTLNWVQRGEGTTPLNILRKVELPDQDRFVYVAAEREEVSQVRNFLKEVGFAKTEAACFSYWTA